MTFMGRLFMLAATPVEVVSQERVVGVKPSAGIMHGQLPIITCIKVESDGNPIPLMYIVLPPIHEPVKADEVVSIKVEAENNCSGSA